MLLDSELDKCMKQQGRPKTLIRSSTLTTISEEAWLRPILTGTSYQVFRLAFHPYTHVTQLNRRETASALHDILLSLQPAQA